MIGYKPSLPELEPEMLSAIVQRIVAVRYSAEFWPTGSDANLALQAAKTIQQVVKERWPVS